MEKVAANSSFSKVPYINLTAKMPSLVSKISRSLACRCARWSSSTDQISYATSTLSSRSWSKLQHRSITRTGTSFLEKSLGLDSYCLLPKKLFRLHGPDSVHLLQGLITNNITKISSTGKDAIFCAFLSPQGRVLFDAFIYAENTTSFIVETDAAVSVDAAAHIKKYMMRSKLKLEPLEDQVWQAWGPTSTSIWEQDSNPTGSDVYIPRNGISDIGCKDPRHKSLGIRFVSTDGTFLFTLANLPPSFTQESYDTYLHTRILLGIPEGSHDFIWGQSLPLESNLDSLSGGISELTKSISKRDAILAKS